MSNFTAIMFSRAPLQREVPGIVVLNSVQTVNGPEEMLAARLKSLRRVNTPWCFFLDDDDDLPADYMDVLGECAAADKPLAYTNETMVVAGEPTLLRAAPYTQDAHIRRPMLIHHLALMRTTDAKIVAATLPRGRYWAEMLLSWQLAKGGATWIDRVGYVWNRGAGLNAKWWTHESQVRSASWCDKNRS